MSTKDHPDASHAAAAAGACAAIEVRNQGEYGTFFVQEGQDARVDGSTRYWCQLTCNTAFGVVGHSWNSMGMPATRFLAKVSKDYLLGKLWGLEAEVYDEATTRKGLKHYLTRRRREGGLDHASARELWDDLADADLNNEHAHVQFVYGDPYWFEVMAEQGLAYKIRNPQAEGFWEYLWPGFINELTQRAQVQP